MVRQKAPVVKPSEYQRILPRPNKAPGAIATAILKSSLNIVGGEDKSELDDQIDQIETVAGEKMDSMLEHDEPFDYEDPFELELNATESAKEFADPEEPTPSADDKTGDYVEQISDRVATKLADMLLPVSVIRA